MNNYFNIDLHRFALSLLPIGLRSPALSLFIRALYSPAGDLHKRFYAFREENIYRLAITSQVCYLEKALNDRFDAQNRRIYIRDGSINRNIFIYTRAEDHPKYTYTRDENRPVHLFAPSEGSGEKSDFVVNVPLSLSFDENEMSALINRYKLASKTYIIRKY